MNKRGIVAAAAVGLLALGGCGSDRFGDPDVLGQIKASTDCDQLQQMNDRAVAAIAHGDGEWTNDQAVGYLNATTDRIKALNC